MLSLSPRRLHRGEVKIDRHRSCHDDPKSQASYWRATVLANAIQFPRILLILYAVNLRLAMASLVPLLAMCAAGIFLAVLLGGRHESGPAAGEKDKPLQLANPFRVLPALKFGALFTAILFFSRAAAATVGEQGAFWTSLLGGLVDVDAIAVSLSDLAQHAQLPLPAAADAILLAVAANAVLKSIIAAYAGSLRLGARVTAGFVVMLGAGVAARWIHW